MDIRQTVRQFFTRTTETKASDRSEDPGGVQFAGSLIKGFIPQHLYRPPFGFPRDQDVQQNRLLGANSYIHSIVSTIQFEVSSTPWDIIVKEGEEEDEDEIRRIKAFFNNPNGNSESLPYLLRAVVKDILELDSGVLVKVFDGAGNFKQLLARDGGSFYKNPDIHGYMGDREDIIPQYYYQWDDDTNTYQPVMIERTEEDLMGLKQKAAYFQYGYNNATIPIAFGKREVIWISANPRTDSVYGRSPLDILGAVLYTLIYGSGFNLDFYTANNIPDGVVQLIGASADDIRAFRERWEANFRQKDVFDNNIKKFYSFPITNTEAKFTPFSLSSKEMEVLEQQKWFWKLVMTCFGVTPAEMGFTEDTNKSTDANQSSVATRRAIEPLLSLIQYHLNSQVMNELDPMGKYEFKFVETDLDEEQKLATLNETYIRMGVKTPEMVAEEMGIDVERLREEKEEARQQALDDQMAMSDYGQQEEDAPPTEEKALVEEALPELDDYFADMKTQLDKLLSQAPDKADGQLGTIQ